MKCVFLVIFRNESFFMNPCRIAIIGAGIAGISAARALYLQGFKEVAIFEASDQIGGRIRSVKHETGWIELGAQWIHGQEGNVLFDYAASKGLIADPSSDYGIEGDGFYCTEDGHLITCPLLKKLINYLDEKKNHMSQGVKNNQNVFDYFKDTFETFIRCTPDVDEKTLNLLKNVFRWFVIFEVIDNSCENLQSLSTLSYTEWENCPGIVDLINFKENYSSLFEELIQDFPLKEFLHLKAAVKKIELSKNFQVKLQIYERQCESNKELLFDHVIITSSIGFLKESLNSGFFGFKLPNEKTEVIQALGFGTINKIFLHYEEPFWDDSVKGFQMLWTCVKDEHSYDNTIMDRTYDSTNFPEWAYCIQGFDLVRNQPKMLMAWIGSYGAKQMETNSDDEIAQVLTNILRRIVPKSCQIKAIDLPNKIFCSRWNSQPYIRGSYSNRTVNYEKLSYRYDNYETIIDILAQPIKIDDIFDKQNNQKPLVLFAGEATDREHYSTTHGAMKSGEREANRLFSFYQSSMTQN